MSLDQCGRIKAMVEIEHGTKLMIISQFMIGDLVKFKCPCAREDKGERISYSKIVNVIPKIDGDRLKLCYVTENGKLVSFGQIIQIEKKREAQ